MLLNQDPLPYSFLAIPFLHPLHFIFVQFFFLFAIEFQLIFKS